MKKTQPYPNNEFQSVDEFVDFCRLYGVYGGDAYELKRKRDKQTAIPEPKIARKKK